jgi:uncharacterized membrane protein YedE/YeeE
MRKGDVNLFLAGFCLFGAVVAAFDGKAWLVLLQCANTALNIMCVAIARRVGA